MQPFINSLKLSTQLRVLRLVNCGLGAFCQNLVDNLPRNIETLDLSHNALGVSFASNVANDIFRRRETVVDHRG